jgi:hypothetical protein
MDFDEQTDAFTFELDNLVERYVREFDINIYTVLGVLEAKQHELFSRGTIEFTEDDDDNLDFLSDLD